MPTLALYILDLKWVAVPNSSTTYSIQYMITEGGPTSCDDEGDPVTVMKRPRHNIGHDKNISVQVS